MYIFYFLSTAPSVRIWADTPVPYAGADKSIRAAQQGAFAASIYLPCVFGSWTNVGPTPTTGTETLGKC